MGVQEKQEKHKSRLFVDSWKENISPTEYEIIRKCLYILLPVLTLLVIAALLLFIRDHEAFRTLALSLAALIGLPLLIWRGVSLDRSSKAAEKQAENASKSHVADTYTKAIEQLGAVDNKGEPNLELRLGGLYALEKIAKANADYHAQIMEVLCAYVRMHCQIKMENSKKGDSKPEENNSDENIESPRIDIQACLTVIGRREILFDKSVLDFSGVEINGANLKYANLNGATFSEANLIEANLMGAKLTRGNPIKMDGPHGKGIVMVSIPAQLDGANLSGANFIEGDLAWTNLRRANLSGADLSGAGLMEAKNLTCEQIQSANIDRETVLPNYIKVTWADDDTYTCEMVENSP